ncbi:acyl-CoA desaturase, partial [Streptomyces sp. SID10244]|nr:acyl-CoA desaturase [Streptomyces sp. SID10244]
NKLALPDRFLRDTADDAPETASERRFAGMPRTRGLKTAIADLRRKKLSRR